METARGVDHTRLCLVNVLDLILLVGAIARIGNPRFATPFGTFHRQLNFSVIE